MVQVTAASDDARYECDVSPVNFRPTMMFQTRAFSFPLKNTGGAHLDFKWSVQTLDGQPDTSGLYKVISEQKIWREQS